MASARTESCAICKWFLIEKDGDKLGQCHRYAPMPQDRTDRVKIWPTVAANDWCGDFAKK